MIPSKIKIGGITYAVIQTSDTLTVNCREVIGLINYEDSFIKLNNRRSLQKMEQTFWHEVFHGIIHERNLEFGGDVDEEITVTELAIAMHQIIVDNPNLFKEDA